MSVCMYVCMCVRMHVCMYACTYVCMHKRMGEGGTERERESGTKCVEAFAPVGTKFIGHFSFQQAESPKP